MSSLPVRGECNNHANQVYQANQTDRSDQTDGPASNIQTCAPQQLVLTRQQVAKSKLLSDLVLAEHDDQPDQPDQPDVCVIDQSSWPGYVTNATKWLSMWLNKCSVCELYHTHGFVAVDQLLAAANWLAIPDCIDEIVETSADLSSLTAVLDWTKLEDVYNRLVDLVIIPPLGLAWPEVAKLCWLCQTMPTILARRLERQFVNRLIGWIDRLELQGDRLVAMPSKTSRSVATRAICGPDWYGQAVFQQTCRLFKSNANQYDRHLAWVSSPVGDAPPGLTVLASLDVPADHVGAGVVAISPCQAYMLWRVRHSAGWTNMIFDLKTCRAAQLPSCVSQSSNVWWLGDHLAFHAKIQSQFFSFPICKINSLNNAVPMVLTGLPIDGCVEIVPHVGDAAARTSTVQVSTSIVGKSTIVHVLVLGRPRRTGRALFDAQFEVLFADSTDPTNTTCVVHGTFPQVGVTGVTRLMTVDTDLGRLDVRLGKCCSAAEVDEAGSKVVWQSS